MNGDVAIKLDPHVPLYCVLMQDPGEILSAGVAQLMGAGAADEQNVHPTLMHALQLSLYE